MYEGLQEVSHDSVAGIDSATFICLHVQEGKLVGFASILLQFSTIGLDCQSFKLCSSNLYLLLNHHFPFGLSKANNNLFFQ